MSILYSDQDSWRPVVYEENKLTGKVDILDWSYWSGVGSYWEEKGGDLLKALQTIDEWAYTARDTLRKRLKVGIINSTDWEFLSQEQCVSLIEVFDTIKIKDDCELQEKQDHE